MEDISKDTLSPLPAKEDLEKAMAEKEALIDELLELCEELKKPEPDIDKPQLEMEVSRGFDPYIPAIGVILLACYNFSRTERYSFWLAVGLTVLGVLLLTRALLMKAKPKLSSQIRRENKVKIDEYNAKVMARNERTAEKEDKLAETLEKIDLPRKEIDQIKNVLEAQ